MLTSQCCFTGYGPITLPLRHDGYILITAGLRDGLYHADCTVKSANLRMVATASIKADPALVHRRCGHIAVSTLYKLALNGSLDNLPAPEQLRAAMTDPSVCGPCQEGGQKAISFQRNTEQKATKHYSRLHVDIAGPRKHSLGGARYFTVLVDEASNFYWVSTHKTKDHAATFLTDTISGFLKAGHVVKSLRSDRDSVFMSENFQRFSKNATFSMSLLPATLHKRMAAQSVPLVC